jgi:hypothetical protein
VSRGVRSTSPFVLIHSDVWTSPFRGNEVFCHLHLLLLPGDLDIPYETKK